MLEFIATWATALMERLGAPGAGLAIALENLFPPIPSEVVLPLAGFTAGRGGMSLTAAVLWTTAGSLVGALALYGLGMLLGAARLRAIAAKVPLMKVSDIDVAEAWFARYGGKAVFFGRMVPIVRSLISLPAGVERMRPGMFCLLTFLGSLIWNLTFILAGYLLGERWHLVEHYVGLYSKAILALAVVVLAMFVVVRVRVMRERRQG